VTTAVVESPESDQARAWLSFDSLVVRHGTAAEIDTALPEMIPPVRSVPSLHKVVQPGRRPGVSSPVGFRIRVVSRASSAPGCHGPGLRRR